jgi:hypothetical protein
MKGEGKKVKTTFTPGTRSGKWSVVISLAFIVLISLKMNGTMPLPTFAIAAIGLIGFIVAVFAFFSSKERSALIYLSILVGLVIIFWIAAEFLFPH